LLNFVYPYLTKSVKFVFNEPNYDSLFLIASSYSGVTVITGCEARATFGFDALVGPRFSK
jgi:hypothetical protein